MPINERVKLVREAAGLSQSMFSERLGIGPSAVSKLENGDNNPSAQTIRLICREFNVDYAWLTDGVGEMYVDIDDETQAALDDLMTGEHENTRALIRTLAKMNEAELDMVDRFIDQFKKELGL